MTLLRPECPLCEAWGWQRNQPCKLCGYDARLPEPDDLEAKLRASIEHFTRIREERIAKLREGA